jgi:uncharacterized protein involved in exopolysaccharide biosynthesis
VLIVGIIRTYKGSDIMRRTLEAIFRYPLRLLAFLIVLPILGVAVMYEMVPRTYQATASLWALQRYAAIGPSGPEYDFTSTPAQTQATALSELLQTHTFVDAAVKGTNLVATLNLGQNITSNPQLLENALYTEISKKVLVTPQAYNLFEISYTSTDPQTARQIVASIISQYGVQSLGLTAASAQNLLESYQTQLASAQRNASNAATTEAQYEAAHPGSKVANDPQLANLDAIRLQAQTNVQNLQNTINTIQQSIGAQGTSANSLFQVLDPPQTPDKSVSRLKNYLIGGGAGLGVALLADILFIVILVRRDRSIYSAVELQQAVALPVIMELPSLSRATISLLIASPAQEQTLLIASSISTNGHMNGL